MKLKNRIFLISVIAISFVACLKPKPIKLKQAPYSSKIVVNGEANTENTFSFQVSRSIPIMIANDSSGYLLQNASVIVKEGDSLIGPAIYQGGYYRLNYKPKAGKSYTVDVAAGAYTPATAEFSMPKAIVTTTSYIDSIGLDNDGFKVGQITLSLTDEPGVKNYYRLLIQYYNAGILTWTPYNFTSNDILFLNNEKLNDGSYLFSDRTFAGKTKVLVFTVPEGLAMGTPKFEISIKCFSEDYFNYLRQTDTYNQDGNGLSNDPIILKTNVINGLGMVGGVCNSRDTIY